MAYDGKIMRRALQRFEEDRQTRENRFQERREEIFRRQPRLREIDSELRSTMSRIIAGALRRGTDPRPAVERLRDENLSLQQERRMLLERIRWQLARQIELAVGFDGHATGLQPEEIADRFIMQLPEVYRMLLTDIDALD